MKQLSTTKWRKFIPWLTGLLIVAVGFAVYHPFLFTLGSGDLVSRLTSTVLPRSTVLSLRLAWLFSMFGCVLLFRPVVDVVRKNRNLALIFAGSALIPLLIVV